MSAERATAICGATDFDFSNQTTVAYFLDGPWYLNANMSEIMSMTGMTETEYWSFYDVNTLNSFGSIVDIELVQLSQWYHCPDAVNGNANFTTNCSSVYLAHAQWGGSLITNNPPAVNATWFPVSLSLNDWNIAGIGSMAYEYYYWSTYYNSITGLMTPNLTAW